MHTPSRQHRPVHRPKTLSPQHGTAYNPPRAISGRQHRRHPVILPASKSPRTTDVRPRESGSRTARGRPRCSVARCAGRTATASARETARRAGYMRVRSHTDAAGALLAAAVARATRSRLVETSASTVVLLVSPLTHTGVWLPPWRSRKQRSAQILVPETEHAPMRFSSCPFPSLARGEKSSPRRVECGLPVVHCYSVCRHRNYLLLIVRPFLRESSLPTCLGALSLCLCGD